MADFSPLSGPRRIALAISNPAWLQDHRFMGQAVLPGVWALEYLARAVEGVFPEAVLTSCTAVHFDKFLALPPPGIAAVDAVAEIAPLAGGLFETVLLTRHVAPRSGISRMKAHVRACFGLRRRAGHDRRPEPRPVEAPRDVFEVAPERLYAEMVPFGRTFRNVVSPVRLATGGARATVAGGDPKGEDTFLRLGSPFPLDAAFHAACAWAQRYRGIVAFPVALQQRLIHQPTCFGHRYDAEIRFREEEGRDLLFDLYLREGGGRLCEVVRGLVMRDVSGGKLQPPDWIRTGLNDDVTR